MGFAAFRDGGGAADAADGSLCTLDGIVALIGAVCFLIMFLIVIDGMTDGSVFGYAFFPAILSLVVWSIATSIARYRALAT